MECCRLPGDVNASQGDVAAAASCYERALGLARSIDDDAEVSKLTERLAFLTPTS